MQTTGDCDRYRSLNDENGTAGVLRHVGRGRSSDRRAPKRFLRLAVADRLHDYLNGQGRGVGVVLERGVKD